MKKHKIVYENKVKADAKAGSEKENSVDFAANGIRNLQEKNIKELIESYNQVTDYTRLWNESMRKTDNKHWQNRMNILSKIVVKDGLEPTDLHVYVCTDVVKQLIDRLAEEKSKISKDTVIDWDKEVFQYINKYKCFRNITLSDDTNDICSWFAQPIKDFMSDKKNSL